MINVSKSRKGLLALTLVTVLAIVSVVTVYAVLIGTFQGGEVTVGGVGSSTVMYSLDNNQTGAWTTTLNASGPGAAWYSRLEINGGDYSGPVTITWQLQQKGATWMDVSGATATTSMTLSGTPQNVYATSDGAYGAGNHNWGSNVATSGAYRVLVTVQSA